MGMNWSVEPLPLRDDQGTLRIGDSRITLDTLVGAYAMGTTAEQLAEDFPSLSLGVIYSVLGYYLQHQQQIETEYLNPRRQQALEIRRKAEARHDPQEFRERLQARRAAQGRG
jgi:uncharacterized protein (DUF433 family)